MNLGVRIGLPLDRKQSLGAGLDSLFYGERNSIAMKQLWQAGWREIGGKRHYFRSKWEANYARYLQWRKENGEIKDWQYEVDTFWFEKIKRGVRSYKPDFRITPIEGETYYDEVKGWMDQRSKTTLRRMQKYYPHIKVNIIDKKRINNLKSYGYLIKGWE